MNRSDLTLLISEIDEVIDTTRQLSFQSLYQQQIIRVLIKAKEALIANQSPKIENLDQAVAVITESVAAQIKAEKQDWLKLQEVEIANLQQQKQDLLQEIETIQKQKKYLIGDFLQVLMERFSDRLQQQITWTCEQIVEQIMAQQSSRTSDVTINNSDTASTTQEKALVETTDKIWQNLQQQFESYHQSLAQGLERMYNIGQQSELKFIEQIDRLVSKLEQIDQSDSAQMPQLYPTIDAISIAPGNDWQAEAMISGDVIPVETPAFEADYLQETLSQLQNLVNPAAETEIGSLIPIAISGEASVNTPPVRTISSLLDLTNHSTGEGETNSEPKSIWYLAIDFGTSKVAAVLTQVKFDSEQEHQLQQYPIYWRDADKQQQSDSVDQHSRIPATVYIANRESSDSLSHDILLENFKPYLNIAISYYEPNQERWEPILGNEQQSISLHQIQTGVTALLQRFRASSGVVAQASGLSSQELAKIMENLSAVIVSCPSQWQDPYSLNLREAVLQAGLHHNPAQIFCLPEATASLIGSITAEQLESELTLVIDLGAANTELALVDIPRRAETVDAANIKLHTYKYGGNEIDLDIFCHLIYPQWRSQLQNTLSQLENYKPQPGSSDRARRNLTHFYLQNEPLGRSCLLAARLSKMILQQQISFTGYLHNQPWTITRTNFNGQIIIPFIDQLQQQIEWLCQSTKRSSIQPHSPSNQNDLTTSRSISVADIRQVVCSGGSIACMWEVLSDWLSSFFGNARIIYEGQDTNAQPVARGLGYLPLFPAAINLDKHRWNDYFLLSELLHAFPARPFTQSEIMELLEARGVDTSVCAERIARLLDGELPPGLIPIDTAYDWLTPASANNARYQKLLAEPLFQQENNYYRPNYQQCLRIRQYLELIANSTHQQITRPLLGNIALETKV